MPDDLHDLTWVRADRLCLGDWIESRHYRIHVDALELHGDDVVVNYGDLTTSIGNILRVRRALQPVNPNRAQE